MTELRNSHWILKTHSDMILNFLHFSISITAIIYTMGTRTSQTVPASPAQRL